MVLAKLLLFAVKLSNVLSYGLGVFPPLYGFLIFLESMVASLFPYTQVSVYLSLIFFLHVLTEPSYISMIVLHTRTQQNVSFPFLLTPVAVRLVPVWTGYCLVHCTAVLLGLPLVLSLGISLAAFLDPVSSLNNS